MWYLPYLPTLPSSISLKKIENIESQTPMKSTIYLIDTEVLSYIFSMLLCPKCEQCTILLGEHVSSKKGLSSSLFLKCSNCNFNREFHTSVLCGKAFDVNNRIVYTMRTLGHGYAGIQKFTNLMNMPKPMAEKNYNRTAKKK